MNMKMKKLSLAVVQVVGAGVVSTILVNSAFAQTAPAPAASNTMERIVVTGSNIPRNETETPSPVQVISIADVKNSGYTSVSDVLRDITANGQGTLTQGFNQAFAGGASGVSLRGLTVGATLVLIDGHRMAPYPLSDDGERPFVDISSIPFDAIERIEILKDGASAVYGSDAIAGVVNVILKKSFTGTSITAESGITQHGGGGTTHVAIMQGFNAGNGNHGYISAEFRKQDQILLSQRNGDWTTFNWTGQGGEDLRPGAVNDIVTTPRVLQSFLFNPTGAGGTSNLANFAAIPSSIYPACTVAQFKSGACAYTNTWAQIQPKSENTNVIGSLTSKFDGDWELNLKASYFDSQQQQTRAPSTVSLGSFAGITTTGPGIVPSIVGAIANYTVPANYPGNPFGVAARVYANVTPGVGRVEDIDSQSFRFVADLSGSIGDWDTHIAAGYTRVQTKVTYTNYVNPTALYNALQSTDPTTRFNLAGGNSQAVMASVTPVVSNTSTDQLNFFEARASRELAKLDGGAAAISVGAGGVYKDLNAPDPIQNQIGTMNLNGAYAIGQEKITNAYAELVLPVLKNLELDAAARFDHYNTYGNSTTPKVGFKFNPMPELGFRGTYSEGFRAPSATENGTAGSLFSFNAIRDPALCPVSLSNGKPDLTNAANVPAFCNFNPTYLQLTTQSLQPEKSKSYTLGLILEPVKGWSTTLDFYQIKVSNQIIPLASLASYNPLNFLVRGAQQIVTYGDGHTGLSPTGLIAYAFTPYTNGQATTTSGFEFETRYKFDLGAYGKLSTRLQYTHMLKYDQTIDGVTYNLAGTHGPSVIGGDTGNPRDRAQMALSWDQGPWTVTTTTNYIGSYDVTDPSSGLTDCVSGIQGYNSQFVTIDPPSQYCKVKEFWYTNLAVNFKMTKELTWTLSIANLFDAKPPLDLQTYGGTGSNSSSNGTGAPYNPSLHQIGAVGRFFNLGVNYRF